MASLMAEDCQVDRCANHRRFGHVVWGMLRSCEQNLRQDARQPPFCRPPCVPPVLPFDTVVLIRSGGMIGSCVGDSACATLVSSVSLRCAAFDAMSGACRQRIESNGLRPPTWSSSSSGEADIRSAGPSSTSFEKSSSSDAQQRPGAICDKESNGESTTNSFPNSRSNSSFCAPCGKMSNSSNRRPVVATKAFAAIGAVQPASSIVTAKYTRTPSQEVARRAASSILDRSCAATMLPSTRPCTRDAEPTRKSLHASPSTLETWCGTSPSATSRPRCASTSIGNCSKHARIASTSMRTGSAAASAIKHGSERDRRILPHGGRNLLYSKEKCQKVSRRARLVLPYNGQGLQGFIRGPKSRKMVQVSSRHSSSTCLYVSSQSHGTGTPLSLCTVTAFHSAFAA